MANPFEAGVEALLNSGERMSAVIQEFADAISGHNREIAQLIREVAEVEAESEYSTSDEED